ncbi:hypothetical protein [Sorangium sp. So ce1024]|uniref:hypothetical protein n=1 Tax=unclassified Sorangium TaxID=2621164 RepID=UPI003F12B3F8
MAIGLSATACSIEALEDYVNDNFGTGGGDAASSSQSNTTAGTGGESTTAGTGGTGGTDDTGQGGGGAGGEAGTGGAEGDGTGGAGGGGTGGDSGGTPLDPACGTDTATFAQVQPILEGSCSNQYCHGNPDAPAGGLDLRAATAAGALVNQDARSCSGERALVVPFMPSNSYLINKLTGVDLCGTGEIKMPPGVSMSEADLKTITDWICTGAPAQ